MISRSRAIVKDLKSMKNLGWLRQPEAWIVLLKKYSPPALIPLLDGLRWGSLEKKVLRGYRWSKLSRYRAEVIVPDRFPNEDFDTSKVSESATVDAATFLVQGLAQYNCDFDKTLKFRLLELRLELLDAPQSKDPVRLIASWSHKEREEFLLSLRTTNDAKHDFSVSLTDSNDRILGSLFLSCHFKLQNQSQIGWKKKKKAENL